MNNKTMLRFLIVMMKMKNLHLNKRFLIQKKKYLSLNHINQKFHTLKDYERKRWKLNTENFSTLFVPFESTFPLLMFWSQNLFCWPCGLGIDFGFDPDALPASHDSPTSACTATRWD